MEFQDGPLVIQGPSLDSVVPFAVGTTLVTAGAQANMQIPRIQVQSIAGNITAAVR